MASPSPHDDPPSNGRIQKPRRFEGWLLVVGLLILLALLGHVLNQQRASKRTADITSDAQRETSIEPGSAETKTDTAQQSPTTRGDNTATPKRSAAPMRVTYMVTHKHRLRDCHGTLTFTRDGLRFESDEPQDSFAARINDVTIEGDVLRIGDKPWRFEFEDNVRVERVFRDWKAGTLRPVSAP